MRKVQGGWGPSPSLRREEAGESVAKSTGEWKGEAGKARAERARTEKRRSDFEIDDQEDTEEVSKLVSAESDSN